MAVFVGRFWAIVLFTYLEIEKVVAEKDKELSRAHG